MSSVRIRTSTRVLRPKPAKPAASSVLHTLSHHSTRVTTILDRPALQVLLSLAQLTSAVLTWSTRSLPCTLALVDVPDVSHRSWSSGLLVRRSKPHVHPSPLQVHRHDTSLLDLLLAIDHRLRAPQLNTTSQETCRTHSFRHGNVSHDSIYSWITLTITHHKTYHKGTSRPCIRNHQSEDTI